MKDSQPSHEASARQSDFAQHDKGSSSLINLP